MQVGSVARGAVKMATFHNLVSVEAAHSRLAARDERDNRVVCARLEGRRVDEIPRCAVPSGKSVSAAVGSRTERLELVLLPERARRLCIKVVTRLIEKHRFLRECAVHPGSHRE